MIIHHWFFGSEISTGARQTIEDYAYDEKGNRVSKIAKVGGVVEAYSYYSQNRLVGYVSDTTIASYSYDALERRIAKTVDGAGVAFVYDTSTDDPLAMDDITLEFSTGAIPVLNRRWAHSSVVDEPVGFEEYAASGPAGSGSERLMYADRQGSIIWVTDPVSNDVVAAYEYDGFGQITQTRGTLEQPYGYTGRENDPESGLHYYRGRNFDMRTGIFLQSDPRGFASGDPNLFAYVWNDPFNWNDPTGMTAAGATAGNIRRDRLIRQAGAVLPLAATAGLAGYLTHVLMEIDFGGVKVGPADPPDPANDDRVPPPPPPPDDCMPERAQLETYREVLIELSREIGSLNAAQMRGYTDKARAWNKKCVPRGYPALPTTFVRG